MAISCHFSLLPLAVLAARGILPQIFKTNGAPTSMVRRSYGNAFPEVLGANNKIRAVALCAGLMAGLIIATDSVGQLMRRQFAID